MPIYQFKCWACGHEVEKQLPPLADKSKQSCEKCRARLWPKPSVFNFKTGK